MNITLHHLQVILAVSLISVSTVGCNQHITSRTNSQTTQAADVVSKKIVLDIVMGSTRQGRTSEKIALLLQNIATQRSDVQVNIIDLRDYELPFLNDETPPVKRTTITDARVQKWSDAINAAQAFILVVPEYNSGYPGVFKNALDSLYKEWNNKPVGLVVYSGGPSGGSSMLGSLKNVVTALRMKPVAPEITIPLVWKAFDHHGAFVDKNIETMLNQMIDQIVTAQNNQTSNS